MPNQPYGHDYLSFLVAEEEPWKYDFARESIGCCLFEANSTDDIGRLETAVSNWFKHSGNHHEGGPLAIAILGRLTEIQNRPEVGLGCRDIMNTYQGDFSAINFNQSPIKHVIAYFQLAHSIGNFAMIPQTYTIKGDSVCIQQSKGGIKSGCIFSSEDQRRDSEFAFLRFVQNSNATFEGADFKSYIEAACLESYFIAVGLFLITQTEVALTLWETFTILGAPVILFVLLDLSKLLNIPSLYKNAMLAFMACACALTGAAHIVNMTVTRPLINAGFDVPTFFRIGYWPSVEMAVDYLAWGFFVGLAFLCIGLSASNTDEPRRLMKKLVTICGALCLVGLLGAVCINENLWYLAPLGYGLGTIAICVQMGRIEKSDCS